MAQLAIDAAENDDYSICEELYNLLKNPYEEQPEHDENKASDLVKSSCEKLLANQTIENFKFNKI